MKEDNPFSPIANATTPIDGGSIDTESPMPYNLLMDKIKAIDEKECIDLKQKNKGGRDNAQASKRRNKGRGVNLQLNVLSCSND